MVKPGHRTTEFLLTVANLIAQLVTALEGLLPARWAALAATINVVGYALARGLAKLHSPADVLLAPAGPTTASQASQTMGASG